MSVFANSGEAVALLGGCFERFLQSHEGAEAATLGRELPVAPVLELRLTDPGAILSVDFAERAVHEGPSAEASIRLEIEASALHDVLLERLDPVQISRLFEDDRAVAEGIPEALAGLVRVGGCVARCYRSLLEERGRTDLLELAPRPRGEIWQADRSPRPVIGHRRPWQRARGTAAGA